MPYRPHFPFLCLNLSCIWGLSHVYGVPICVHIIKFGHFLFVMPRVYFITRPAERTYKVEGSFFFPDTLANAIELEVACVTSDRSFKKTGGSASFIFCSAVNLAMSREGLLGLDPTVMSQSRVAGNLQQRNQTESIQLVQVYPEGRQDSVDSEQEFTSDFLVHLARCPPSSPRVSHSKAPGNWASHFTLCQNQW